MSAFGTQEFKRARRAMPSPVGSPVSRVWLCILLAWIVAFVWVHLVTHQPQYLVLAAPGVLGLCAESMRLVRAYRLLRRAHAEWGPPGIRCLVVYSRSVAWEEHVRMRWLPRLESHAIVMDRSNPGSWKGRLPEEVFRCFCGSVVNYSPAVVVLRGSRWPLVFRFYYAFFELKKGRGQYLAEMERRMFDAVLGPDSVPTVDPLSRGD